MQGYFARPVISADDLEAGQVTTETSNPRSLFLQYCLNEGNRITEFGRLLAPLGIRYVILTKSPGDRSFSWLSRQEDMREVSDSGTIAVYENEEVVPDAYDPSRHLVLRDWGQVIALAQRTSLLTYLIQVRHARPGPLDVPATAGIRPVPTPTLIKTAGSTPVSESVNLQHASRTVVLTKPAYAGWQLAGYRTTSQFGVTAAFTISRGPGRPAAWLAATYGPWRLVEACDIAGICLAAGDLGLLAIVLILYRRRAGKASPLLTKCP